MAQVLLTMLFMLALSLLIMEEIKQNSLKKSENVIFGNPHPEGKEIGDCAVRMLCNLLDIDWDTSYDILAEAGKKGYVLMNQEGNILKVLAEKGYDRVAYVTSKWHDFTTFEDFVRGHKEGNYVLFSDGHVVTVKEGKIYDSWDSHNDKLRVVAYNKDNAEDIESDSHIYKIKQR